MLTVLTAIWRRDAGVLGAEVLRPVVPKVLTVLGQRRQRFTDVQMAFWTPVQLPWAVPLKLS